MQLLAAPDKFRGTLTAREAAAAIAAGAARAGWTADELPLADGGEGTLDVLGGGNRRTTVTGPLGDPVDAAWRLEDGRHRADRGRARVRAHARRRAGAERPARARRAAASASSSPPRSPKAPSGSIVAVGGVASTDGGVGALEALPHPLPRPARRGVRRRRALPRRGRRVRAAEGSDTRAGRGSCASGSRSSSSPTFRARARRAGSPAGSRRSARGSSPASTSSRTGVGLDERLAEADLVVTGEGLVDATSVTGKVVGRVLARASEAGVEALVVAGDVAPGSPIDAAFARGALRSGARARRAGGVPHGARRNDPGDPPRTDPKLQPEMPKPVARTRPHLAYRPGLDGLRAIAVAGVFLYHSRIDWLPGGFLGVDLFFVLSGYLITSLLLVEWEARNRIDLRRFWLRRARRLLPALVVVVLASLVLAAIFARDDLAHTRSDAVSSLFYFTNWHLIVANHSYFNLMGRPSLLQHLWSLAVEEQFYVVWPLLLVPCLVLVGRKRLPMLVDRRHRRARRRSCGSSTTRPIPSRV